MYFNFGVICMRKYLFGAGEIANAFLCLYGDENRGNEPFEAAFDNDPSKWGGEDSWHSNQESQ
jgi:hypothetical protein